MRGLKDVRMVDQQGWTAVLSLLPPTAPVAMMTRLTIGGVPGWQIALAFALLVLAGGLLWRLVNANERANQRSRILLQNASDGIHMEIHVDELGRTASHHLHLCEQGSPVDIVFGELRFSRPNRFLQPCPQRDIVGDPPKQRHRRVSVGVDKPRNGQLAPSVNHIIIIVVRGYRRRGDRSNEIPVDTNIDRQIMMLNGPHVPENSSHFLEDSRFS